MHDIINQLLITAWQWDRFGGAQYERQFEALFNQLQRVTGKSYEEAEEMLMAELGEEGVAA